MALQLGEGSQLRVSCTKECKGSCPLKFSLFNYILLQSWGEGASWADYFYQIPRQRTLD